MTIAATIAIPAPFFLVDVAAFLPGLFIVGGSVLGGSDVLGDAESDELAQVVSIVSNFPSLPPVLVMNAGIAKSPTTGLVTALSGEVFAFIAGAQVQFDLQTELGTQFSIMAVYNGRQNVFVG